MVKPKKRALERKKKTSSLVGSMKFLEWLDELKPKKAVAKVIARIERLKQLEHELRRPEADLLRDDVWELRIKFSSVQCRVLYFFHERAGWSMSDSTRRLPKRSWTFGSTPA
jgi:putative component of toxin-antitoxin plasmid stabilization module